MEAKSVDRKIPLIIAYNLGDICGEEIHVCIIGAFRSSKARDKLENSLLMVRDLFQV